MEDNESSFSDWESIHDDVKLPGEGSTTRKQIVLEFPPEVFPHVGAASPAAAAAAGKNKNSASDNSAACSSISSFVPVSRFETMGVRSAEPLSTASASSYHCKSTDEDSSILSNFEILSLSSGVVLECKRCKFHNKHDSVVCASCNLALVANPNMSIDAQIALHLQQQEENTLLELERKRNQIYQDPLYEPARILSNDIKHECYSFRFHRSLATLPIDDLIYLILRFTKYAMKLTEPKNISLGFKCTPHTNLKLIQSEGLPADQRLGMVEVSDSLADALSSYHAIAMKQIKSLCPIPENRIGGAEHLYPDCLCWIVAIVHSAKADPSDNRNVYSPDQTLPFAHFQSHPTCTNMFDMLLPNLHKLWTSEFHDTTCFGLPNFSAKPCTTIPGTTFSGNDKPARSARDSSPSITAPAPNAKLSEIESSFDQPVEPLAPSEAFLLGDSLSDGAEASFNGGAGTNDGGCGQVTHENPTGATFASPPLVETSPKKTSSLGGFCLDKVESSFDYQQMNYGGLAGRRSSPSPVELSPTKSEPSDAFSLSGVHSDDMESYCAILPDDETFFPEEIFPDVEESLSGSGASGKVNNKRSIHELPDLGDGAAANGRQWRCRQCMFLNEVFASKCAMCQDDDSADDGHADDNLATLLGRDKQLQVAIQASISEAQARGDVEDNDAILREHRITMGNIDDAVSNQNNASGVLVNMSEEEQLQAAIQASMWDLEGRGNCKDDDDDATNNVVGERSNTVDNNDGSASNQNNASDGFASMNSAFLLVPPASANAQDFIISNCPPSPSQENALTEDTADTIKQGTNCAWDENTRSLKMNAIISAVEALGSGLAICCNSRDVLLWNERSGLYNVLKGASNRISCLTSAASATNKHLFASGDVDGGIVVYKLILGPNEEAYGDMTSEFSCGNRGHYPAIMCLRFLPTGTALAGITCKGYARLWNLKDNSCLCTLKADHAKAFPLGLTTACFSPDGNSLGYVENGGRFIHFWRFNGERQKLTGHESSTDTVGRQEFRIRAISFSANEEYLASAGNDCTVRLWAIKKDGSQCTKIIHVPAAVSSLAFSPDSTLIAGGSVNGTIHVWEVSTGSEEAVRTFTTGTGSIQFLAFLTGGETLVSSGWSGHTLRFWGLEQ